jgi:hypothetical protein
LWVLDVYGFWMFRKRLFAAFGCLRPSAWVAGLPGMAAGVSVGYVCRVGVRARAWEGRDARGAEWDGMKLKERGAEWADGRLEREWDGWVWGFGTNRARRPETPILLPTSTPAPFVHWIQHFCVCGVRPFLCAAGLSLEGELGAVRMANTALGRAGSRPHER